jgi:hypothetical protein
VKKGMLLGLMALARNGGGQPDGRGGVQLLGPGIVRAHARGGSGVCGPDHFLRPVRTLPEPPMISGVITTRHVIGHAALIVREFGAAAYLRCCLVLLRRRPATFLECIFGH